MAAKKFLPAVPTTSDMPASPSVMKVDRSAAATCSKNEEMYSPVFLEYSLISEFVMLQKQQLPGVYVIPSAGSALKWFGVFFIRSGIYQGGVFRFTLYVPDNYPDSDCPILVFEPPIYNPLINMETGELDVKRAFPKWRRNVNHLWQVIQYARSIFHTIETDSPMNPEAADLYEKDTVLYRLEVAKSIKVANERLYDKPQTDDPHAIHFTPWDPSVHEDIRRRIFSRKEEDEQGKSSASGLSWMRPGSLDVFSKADSL